MTLPVPPPVAPPRPPRWNLRRANWGCFSDALILRMAESNWPDDLEAAEARLISALTQAAHTIIPHHHLIAVSHRNRWYYNEKVREPNHRVNQARKNNRRHNTEETRGLLRTAVRRATQTADRVQEDHWLAWCGELDGHTSSAALWRKLRAVSAGAVTRPAEHPSPQAEAERLAEVFSSRAAPARLPPQFRDWQEEANPRRLAAFREACL